MRQRVLRIVGLMLKRLGLRDRVLARQLQRRRSQRTREEAAGSDRLSKPAAYELDVPGRTLSDLLDEVGAPEIDLLSLDIEGFEAHALQGLDLSRHAPRFILVEIHDSERNRPPIDALLRDRYVEHGWLSPIDLLYARSNNATPVDV